MVEEEWEDEADVDGDEDGIAAILHYLPTLEPSGNGERKMKTLYIYEIHAHPSLQGRGLGTLLLELADDLAGAMGCEKVMLTVFTSNEGARRLYARHGYEHWDEEVVPVVRRLRGARGRTQGSGMREPSYVILAKDVGTAVTK